MNDTKWKKKNVEPEIKTFSQDESNIPIIEGFDEEPDVIIQKIKEISKNKERKKSNPNYKNIPQLDNIYEKGDDNNDVDDGFEEIEKSMNEITDILNGNVPEEANNLSEPTLNKESFKIGKQNKKIEKKIGKINKEVDAKKEVGVEKKESGTKDGGKCKRNTAIAGIVDKINKGVSYIDKLLFKNFDKYLTIGVGAVYDTVEGKKKSSTGSKNRTADITLIKNQIYYLFAIPIALLITYNWFYITFYKDESNQRISREINIDISQFTSILNFLFYYLTKPVDVFNYYVLKLIPNTVNSLAENNDTVRTYLNPLILFFISLLIVMHTVMHYSTVIKNLVIACVDFASKTVPFSSIVYPIIVFNIIMGFFPTSIFGIAEFAVSISILPITIVAWIIKMVFTFSSVKLSGLFLTIFIIFHSFFSLLLYSNYGYKGTIEKINEYLYTALKNLNTQHCPPGSMTWFEKMFRILVEIIYKCLYEFIFIMVFVVGIFVYSMYMKSLKCKMVFSVLNSLIIVIISMLTYYMKLKNVLKELFDRFIYERDNPESYKLTEPSKKEK